MGLNLIYNEQLSLRADGHLVTRISPPCGQGLIVTLNLSYRGDKVDQHIFISYHPQDEGAVRALRKFFELHGVRCITSTETPYEIDTNGVIDPGIRKTAFFLAVVSNETLRSEQVLCEVKYALRHQRHKKPYPVIAMVLLDDPVWDGSETESEFVRLIFSMPVVNIQVTPGHEGITKAVLTILSMLREILPHLPQLPLEVQNRAISDVFKEIDLAVGSELNLSEYLVNFLFLDTKGKPPVEPASVRTAGGGSTDDQNPSTRNGDLPKGLPKPDFPFDSNGPEHTETESLDSDQVEFAVFAPRRIRPQLSFMIDVWAYLPHQYSYVAAIAQGLGQEDTLARKSGIPVAIDSILTINLMIAGLYVEDPIDTVVWKGVPANASYIVNVPFDTAPGQYSGKAIVTHGGMPIAKIKFLVSVHDAVSPEIVDQTSEATYPKSAFASYARANAVEVASRLQGMKKVRPELDIFQDVFSLRSGQNWQEKLEEHVPSKDTFYLFWSQPAARSKWVEKEWRLALSKRGLNYIDPVPLESPDIAPPPPELSALHFSDAHLMHIEYQRLRQKQVNSKL